MSKAKLQESKNGTFYVGLSQAIKDELNKTATRKELAERFHVSVSTINTFINHLSKAGVEIQKKRHSHNWQEIAANLK